MTCDFTEARMQQIGEDRVRVDNVVGHPPPTSFKVFLLPPFLQAIDFVIFHPISYAQVTSTYASGYRCTAAATVIGGRAADKARKTAEAILARCRRIFAAMRLPDFTRTHVQAIGDNESYGAAYKTKSVRCWRGVL